MSRIKIKNPYFQRMALFIFCMLFVNACYSHQNSSNDMNLRIPSIELKREEVVNSSIQEENFIVPGKSIGKVQIGQSVDELKELIGNPLSNVNVDSSGCPYEILHWYIPNSLTNKKYLTRIIAINGKVAQISTEGGGISTQEGILAESQPQSVRQYYPKTESFAYLGIKLPNTDKFLTYWVEQKRGIAFEFYYNQKEKQRKVSSIIVFDPNEDFYPNGCSVNPEYWVKLKQFELELPLSFKTEK